MTKALRDVFTEVKKLPEAEQEQLAAAIRAEIEAEAIWAGRLAASTKTLEELADRFGRKRPSGFASARMGGQGLFPGGAR